jgi:hypothetical protein
MLEETQKGELLDFQEQLGYESEVFVKHMRGILGPFFVGRVAQDVETAAAELRRLGPAQDPVKILDEPPERSDQVEARTAAATRLAQLIGALREVGDASVAARIEALMREFSTELAVVKPLMKLLETDGWDEDDGWHRPPGFTTVEVPFVAPPPPPTPPKTPPRPPTPPGGGDAVKMKIRLHGVTLGDVRCNSEILLMEKLADIVAKECKVPREWLQHIRVVDSSDGDPRLIPDDKLI